MHYFARCLGCDDFIDLADSMTPNSETKPTEAMFSSIAARYDRCNHLFSLGIDHRWRRHLVKQLNLKETDAALDLCCGTGDMAFALLKHSPLKQAVAVDCSETMIQLAQEKRMLRTPHRWMKGKSLRLSVEDAARLPFEDTVFDVVTCAFGLRNIPDRTSVLTQMHRLLRPGGRAGICEFSLPSQPVLRAVYWFYLSRVMPLLGRVVVGNAEPLRYLARSIRQWHQDVNLAKEFKQAGFAEVHSLPLTCGIVTITVAKKN